MGQTLTYTFEADGMAFDITITDLGAGVFAFEVSISDDSALIGDIRAFYLDIPGDVGEFNLSVTDVAGNGAPLEDIFRIRESSVFHVASRDTNMKGARKGDGFDLGVEFGGPGKKKGDDYQSVSFTLTGAEELSLEDFNLADFGIRLTSVGEADGPRKGSLKITGEVSAPDAVDDAISIQEDGAIGGDAAKLNVLDNDTDPENDDLYVASVGGGELTGGSITFDVTTEGGVQTEATLTVDGELFFDTNGDFEGLDEGEADSFSFTYAAADGNGGSDTATVTVTIIGEAAPADVDVNIVFLIDTSGSAFVEGIVDPAIFDGFDTSPFELTPGDGAVDVDVNGDGIANSDVDAALFLTIQFQQALAASGVAASVEIGVAGFSLDFVAGESFEFVTDDQDNFVFTENDDLADAFLGSPAVSQPNSFATLNGALAAANLFFEATDDGDELNLVYILSQGTGVGSFPAGDAGALADEAEDLLVGAGAILQLAGVGGTAVGSAFDVAVQGLPGLTSDPSAVTGPDATVEIIAAGDMLDFVKAEVAQIGDPLLA